MDFKVAGTADVVTALQLDTKIDGLPADVLAKALLQAKEARLKILEVMAGAIAEPRDEVAENAPKIVSIEIPIDKIGEVIGPKGKVINALQQETGADIAVDDDGMVGTVTIGAKDSARWSTRPAGASSSSSTRRRPRSAPSTRARWSTSPSSAPSSTSCPGATACCTSPSSARVKRVEQRRGRRHLGPGGRGPRRRHRPAGQGVPVAGRRAPPRRLPGRASV